MRNSLVIFGLAIFAWIAVAATPVTIDHKFTDIAGNTVTMKDKTVFLITTTDCGYCLKNIYRYNEYSDKYSDMVQMIALYETGSKEIKAIKDLYPDKEVELRNWVVVPKAAKYYRKFIKQETYPQIVFVRNGKVEKIVIGTLPEMFEEIDDYFELFISE